MYLYPVIAQGVGEVEGEKLLGQGEGLERKGRGLIAENSQQFSLA